MKKGLVAYCSRLLECEQQAAAIIHAIGVCAGGRDDIRNERPASHNANAVNRIRFHDEICVSISKLGLESGEEAILTLTPCDDDLDACHLFAASIHEDELQQA